MDANDLHRRHGLEAVRAAVDNAQSLEEFAAEFDEGSDSHEPCDAKSAEGALDLIDGCLLLQEGTPVRHWLVEGLIPAHDVTLLGGDGGTGKTTLAMQLALAVAWGGDWIGLTTAKGRVVYLSAEEPKDELHYRLDQIARAASAARQPDFLQFISRADDTSELVSASRTGELRKTPLFDRVAAAVKRLRPRLLVVDAAADVFGANENDRTQVRTFIRHLRSLALEFKCAVLLLAHPSQEGIRSGSGYSGSTHWNNSVRSRLYFSAPGKDDPDARLLELLKANRAPRGTCFVLRYSSGCFVQESESQRDSLQHQMAVRAKFLALLQKREDQGRHVGPKKGPSYAPAEFAKDEREPSYTSKQYERAMESLLEEGAIKIEEGGPPSRRTSKIVRVR